MQIESSFFRALVVVWCSCLVLGGPLVLPRRQVDVIDWIPEVVSLPCPSRRVDQPVRIFDQVITIAGLACDWDKMETMDRTKIGNCEQAVIKIGKRPVKVACLRQRREPQKAAGIRGLKGQAVLENTHHTHKVKRCVRLLEKLGISFSAVE